MPKINLGGEGASAPTLPDWLSLQQRDALRFTLDPDGGNMILVAVAGAGKTTTLVEMCKVLRGSVVFAAFNKKIADEIGSRLAAAGLDRQRVRSGTFHSFGFQAWKRAAPSVTMDKDKLFTLSDQLGIPKNLSAFCRTLVSLAKQDGAGIVWNTNDWLEWQAIVEHYELNEKLYDSVSEELSLSDEEDLVAQGIEWSQRLLAEATAIGERVIDFDDMLYMPLLRGALFYQNNWVLVDEAQDTNALRRIMAGRMLLPKGRLVAVGDPRQAIYGFTGANADALDLIREEFDAVNLPLTVSYRCPKAVVRHAQRWVTHIQAHDEAPEGSVSQISLQDFEKQTPDRTDAILCRVTKPLVQLALSYIKRRIPAHVEGRDIGKSLVSLTRKWKTPQTVGQFIDRLDDWAAEERVRLLNKNQEAKAVQLDDKVQSLLAIAYSLTDDSPLDELRQSIESLFQDTDGRPVRSITLSTIHKAKGREWDRVWLYGRNLYMPHPFARQEWEKEQEYNLIYVAVTRAKAELVEVVLPPR